MELVNDKAEKYAQQFTAPLDELLTALADYTTQNHPQAHMLSGHVQGKVLEMLSCMIQPTRILEIGTFTGFSALCLLKGLHPDGKLHTIELREDVAAIAEKYFTKANVNNRVTLHVGNALQLIPVLDEKWELVFIDADKTGYIDYYELILPYVKQGGFILVDNVLFHGEVLEPVCKGKNAKAVQAFNKHVTGDKRVEQVILTIRDGLMLIKKL
jgi:caffeoyl-CoA O-methyltransferase